MSATLPAPGWVAAAKSPMGPHAAPPACGEDEALRSAHRLASRLEDETADASALFAASGLGTINVAAAWGGSELSYETIAHVVRIVAAANQAAGEAARHHLALVAAIRAVAMPPQQTLLVPLVLRGLRFGPQIAGTAPRFEDAEDTGSILVSPDCDSAGDHRDAPADLLPVSVRDTRDRAWYAIVEQAVLADRTGDEPLRVPGSHLLPIWRAAAPDGVKPVEAIRVLLHASAEAGSAGRAIADRIAVLRGGGAPDPAAVEHVGGLRLQLDAAIALIEKAGRAVDRALIRPTNSSVALAQVAAAGARILTAELAGRFGTTVPTRQQGLDASDPARSRYALLGRFYLDGTMPSLSR